jgi:hypothetical protein
MAATATPTDAGYVKLQTENFNLREALEVMKKKLTETEEVAQKAQARATVLENQQKSKESKQGQADSIYETKIAELETQLRQANMEKLHASETLENVTKERENLKRNLAELVTLRKQVDDMKKREKTLQQVIDQLNQQLESQPTQQNSGSAMNAEQVEEEIKSRLDELRQELEAKAEEEMFAMTVELEETINKQKAEIEDLKKQIQSSAQIVQANSPPRPGDGTTVERALAEKAIALRVKDGAIAESGLLRTKLEKTDELVKNLRAQIDLLEKQLAEARAYNASASPVKQDPETPVASDDSRMLKAQMAEKDKLVKYLQDRVADLEVRIKTANSERDAAKEAKTGEQANLEQHITELNQHLEEMQVTHAAEIERLKVDLQIVAAERDKALDAGRRAFLERNNALNDAKAAQKKEQLLARLKTGSGGAEVPRDKVEIVFRQVESAYDDIVGKIEQAKSSDERRDVMWDKLFEYEHRLWNLNNDLQSLHAIRKIREEDLVAQSNDQWAARCEEYMSAIEILRMQIRELGKEPMC